MRIRFTNIPSAPDGTTGFIELENNIGKSVRGTWINDGNDVLLLIPNEETDLLHANLDKLWKALGIKTYKEANGKDVFTLVAERIADLEDEIYYLKESLNGV